MDDVAAKYTLDQLESVNRARMEKQGYRFVGNHSAVKICEWTKKMLRGEGGCYKYIFYGIRSHQCLQMTTSLFCASRCKFCWRGQKAPVAKEWYGPVDSPKHIIDHAIDAHIDLLQGFKGTAYQTAVKERVDEMEEVRHVALSLTGEPISYPDINLILDAFHKRKISTFLVTNAQYPEQIAKIKHITQLYVSLDAPNKKLLKTVDNPLFQDYWERLLESLDILATRNYRTCIRLTMIKDENMIEPENYATLIKRGSPDFIELKSYVHVGAGRAFYSQENMPFIEDMKAFMDELLKYLPEYEYIREHKPSRAILLAKKSLDKKVWIDFPTFFELSNNDDTYTTEDYAAKIMMPNV